MQTYNIVKILTENNSDGKTNLHVVAENGKVYIFLDVNFPPGITKEDCRLNGNKPTKEIYYIYIP
jgi:hypothetical protein